jgi:peptidoglycan/xylan/chitin deacetylase (PgdA/CDA1 family)
MKIILKFKILLLLIIFIKYASAIEVAITVDDLPSHGDLPNDISRTKIAITMLAAFKKHHISGVYGFINGYNVTDQDTKNVLKLWVDSGQLLGNHTYSHMNITANAQDQYITNITQNELILRQFMVDKNYKYFRYPYLREGNTKDKRDAIRKFLFDNNYKIAEVTLDFWDYEWNNPYARCIYKKDKKSINFIKKSYLDSGIAAIPAAQALSQLLFRRDIKYILLLHIGALDAQMLDQLLTQYEKLGVKFISLPDALSDKAYNINSGTIRDTGYTFLNEIRVSRKLHNPDIVKIFYDSIPENKLAAICK